MHSGKPISFLRLNTSRTRELSNLAIAVSKSKADEAKGKRVKTTFDLSITIA
jgi:hypothetical protein